MCFIVEINQDVSLNLRVSSALYAMHSHMQIQACSQVGCFSGSWRRNPSTHNSWFLWKGPLRLRKRVLSRVSKKKKRTVPPTASSAFSASHSSSAKEGKGGLCHSSFVQTDRVHEYPVLKTTKKEKIFKINGDVRVQAQQTQTWYKNIQ